MLPDLTPFETIKGEYLKIMGAVFDEFKLDALVYPHLTELLPALYSSDEPVETTVSEVRPLWSSNCVEPARRCMHHCSEELRCAPNTTPMRRPKA